MKIKIILFAFAIGALLASPTANASNKTEAVFPFSAGEGVDIRAAQDAYNIFVGEAKQVKGYSIMTAQDIIAVMGESARGQVENCFEQSCACRMAPLFGSPEVIVGAINIEAGSYVVRIKRLNAQECAIVTEFNETMLTGTQDDFGNLMNIIKKSIEAILPQRRGSFADYYAVKEPAGEAESESDSSSPALSPYQIGAIASAGVAAAGIGLFAYGLASYFPAVSDRDELKTRVSAERLRYEDVSSEFEDIQNRGDKAVLFQRIGAGIAGAGIAAMTALLIVDFMSDKPKGKGEVRDEKPEGEIKPPEESAPKEEFSPTEEAPPAWGGENEEPETEPAADPMLQQMPLIPPTLGDDFEGMLAPPVDRGVRIVVAPSILGLTIAGEF